MYTLNVSISLNKKIISSSHKLYYLYDLKYVRSKIGDAKVKYKNVTAHDTLKGRWM